MTSQSSTRRVLFLVWGEIEREQGASQVALNLRAALESLGHDARIQRVDGNAAGSSPWLPLRRYRRASVSLARSEAFDAVDLPAQFASSQLAQENKVVARSVQPEHGYAAVVGRRQRPLAAWNVRRLIHAFRQKQVLRGIENGRRLAHRVLCLGSADLEETVRLQSDLRDKSASYVAAPSEQEREMLRSIAGARSADRIGAAKSNYLWIGRWSAHKGTQAVIQFVREFLRANPEARLTIAGIGDLASDPTDGWLAREDRVRLVPRFDRTQLGILLAEHDAGLFTSEIEGWGLSLQEMLESGLPVFATRAGAYRDLVPYFPRQLLDYPPARDSILPHRESPEAFSRYASMFNWRRIAQDYLRAVFGEMPIA